MDAKDRWIEYHLALQIGTLINTHCPNRKPLRPDLPHRAYPKTIAALALTAVSNGFRLGSY